MSIARIDGILVCGLTQCNFCEFGDGNEQITLDGIHREDSCFLTE